MKRRFCFLIIMVLALFSLFSEETVRIVWTHEDDSVSLYRWRRGDEEWNITKDTEAQSFYKNGETEIYHIEASYDGEKWSEDHPIIITTRDMIDVSWSWDSNSEGVNFYRYRLNGGEWNTIEAPQTNSGTITIAVGDTYRIEIQASFDGVNWSQSAESILTTVKAEEKKPVFSFELSSSLSLSFALYDFYNGHEIEGARYLMGTRPSFSSDIEADLFIGRHFRVYADLSYARERKNETIIPDAFVVEHRQYGGGLDVLFPIKDKWRPYIGLNINRSKDINAGFYSRSTFYGVRMGLDYFINGNIYFGLRSGVKLAHNDDPDPLYRSYTYLMDPVGIKMGVKF